MNLLILLSLLSITLLSSCSTLSVSGVTSIKYSGSGAPYLNMTTSGTAAIMTTPPFPNSTTAMTTTAAVSFPTGTASNISMSMFTSTSASASASASPTGGLPLIWFPDMPCEQIYTPAMFDTPVCSIASANSTTAAPYTSSNSTMLPNTQCTLTSIYRPDSRAVSIRLANAQCALIGCATPAALDKTYALFSSLPYVMRVRMSKDQLWFVWDHDGSKEEVRATMSSGQCEVEPVTGWVMCRVGFECGEGVWNE